MESPFSVELFHYFPRHSPSIRVGLPTLIVIDQVGARMRTPQVASSPSPTVGVGVHVEGGDVGLTVGHVLHVERTIVPLGVEKDAVRYRAELAGSVIVA